MKSGPIKRHGGKSYLAPKIRALFPPHTRYVEPYFGGGAVMFAGDGEGVAEYANDLDRELTNFWRVLQCPELFAMFKRRIDATPFSEVEFERQHGTVKEFFHTPIEIARNFFVSNRQSRQALGRDFATPTKRLRAGKNEQVSAWLSAVDGLPAFHARLRRVEIRCRPAIGLIEELDSPDTLFYCDPPYLHETRSSTGEYTHEMTAEQHAELLETLRRAKGKAAISGYRSELYDDKLHFWRRVDFDAPNQASSAKVKERKTECVWMNYGA